VRLYRESLMEFRLEADGIHIACYSPVWTQTLINWGARLVEPSQAEELRRALETAKVANQPTLGSSGDPAGGVLRS
jgi:hypothetical protein